MLSGWVAGCCLQVQTLHRALLQTVKLMAANQLPYTLGFQPDVPKSASPAFPDPSKGRAEPHERFPTPATNSAAVSHGTDNGGGTSSHVTAPQNALANADDASHAAHAVASNVTAHPPPATRSPSAANATSSSALPQPTPPEAPPSPTVAVELFPCRFHTDLTPHHVSTLSLQPTAQASIDSIALLVTDSLLRLGGACLHLGTLTTPFQAHD